MLYGNSFKSWDSLTALFVANLKNFVENAFYLSGWANYSGGSGINSVDSITELL